MNSINFMHYAYFGAQCSIFFLTSRKSYFGSCLLAKAKQLWPVTASQAGVVSARFSHTGTKKPAADYRAGFFSEF